MAGKDTLPEELRLTEIPELDAERGNARDFVIAAFDLNGDERLDLIVFEREHSLVSQVMLGRAEGGYDEATAELTVPEYLTRFLAIAAEDASLRGAVAVRTDAGAEREVFLLGRD